MKRPWILTTLFARTNSPSGGISCFPKVEEDSLLGDDELLDGEDTVEIKKSVLL